MFLQWLETNYFEIWLTLMFLLTSNQSTHSCSCNRVWVQVHCHNKNNVNYFRCWKLLCWLRYLWWAIRIAYFCYCGTLIVIRTVGDIKNRTIVIRAFHPSGRGSIPDGIRNFNFYTVTGRVLSLAVARTFCWQDIHGDPPLCIYLVFWSIVCCP